MDTPDKVLKALRASVKEVERLRRDKRALLDAQREPIAVIGMACHYPGGIHGPDEFWQLLREGGDAIGPFPRDRGWPLDLYDPDPDRLGTSTASGGGFLYEAADFDPVFFGISPREALTIDPQQRWLLRTSWEALEHAGLRPSALRGSQTGVFVGIMYSDYGGRLAHELEDLDGYVGIGSSAAVASGRISYTLGFVGPAVSIDTACSSSLVALHLAADSLRTGASKLALCGGVTLMATPQLFVEFSRQRAMSPDGRCRSFSAAADGAGWSEGVGMLVLERLSDARANGHRVLGLIRASEVNQDGRSQGLTAPNGPSQKRVILSTLERAKLSPADIDVVDGHGTGTRLGDPIEVQALLETYGSHHTRSRPLLLGSVKSNIGHAQAAAGVAGIIKLILALQHELVPKTLHVEAPTPEVDWSTQTVKLVTEATPWPRREGHIRRGAVSSFGISGTNAHVIVEEAPPLGEDVRREQTASTSPWPLILSAKTREALRGQAQRLREFLELGDPVPLVDLAHSLLTTREQFEWRAAVVASETRAADAPLEALAAGQQDERYVDGSAGPAGKLVFVFPGQGSQWIGMAAELMDGAPEFRAHIEACARIMDPLTDWSLLEVLASEAPDALARVDIVQPVLFAMMTGLAQVWRTMGLSPDAVVGHSQGEIAAAYVAGALSLEDAVTVVTRRSQVIAQLSGRGAMLVVQMPAEQTRTLLEGYEGRLSLAVDNGQASNVISGEPEAIEELANALEAKQLFARKVNVDYASHSPQIEEIRAPLLDALATLQPRTPGVPFFSTARLGLIEEAAFDAEYWFENLRNTVQFAGAVDRLIGSNHRYFVELSPHPVLLVALSAMIGARPEHGVVVPSMIRNQGSRERLVLSLGELHVNGYDVDWSALFAAQSPLTLPLPTYAFQAERFWRSPKHEPSPPTSPAHDQLWTKVEAGELEALGEELALDDEQRDALASILPALQRWHQRTQQLGELDDWFYQELWRPAAVGDDQPQGVWILVLPDGLDEDWEKLLAPLKATDGLDLRRLVLTELLGPEELRVRLSELVDEGVEVSGIISALALDETDHPAHPDISAGVAATLALLRAMTRLQFGGRLWLLTRSAVACEAGEAPAAPRQAMVSGLGRVFGLEHPKRWGGLIDLPTTLDSEVGEQLAACLANPSGEEHYALRADGARVRRLARARLAKLDAFSARGTALITGGTGALGRYTAGWLAERGAQHLVLTSRRGADAPGATALTEELRARGVEVTIAKCDASSPEQLAELLATLEREGHELRAIFHAAGVAGSFTEIEQLELSEFTSIVSAKVTGARVLDQHSRGLELDAFVLFSSVSATWGSARQAAYSAANAYLDAVAAQRRGAGLPATAVAWGAWGGQGGMAGEHRDELEQWGLRAMEPSVALMALEHALADERPTLTVANVDWPHFMPLFAASGEQRLFEEIELAAPPPSQSEEGEQGSALLADLAELTAPERKRRLTSLVLAHTAEVLGFADPEQLDPGRGFSELGLDSLMAVQLRQALQRATALTLPATLAFDHPSPRHVAQLLEDRLELEGGDTNEAEPEDEGETEFDDLSDDELLDLADGLLGEGTP